MELLESNDFKSELLKKSEKHRAELAGEVKLISERTEKILTNALIIGGALAATYFLMSQFSGPKKEKRKAKTRKIKIVNGTTDNDEEEVVESVPAAPGIVAQIGTALASQATVFLLDLAKEKLSEYLQAQAEKKEK